MERIINQQVRKKNLFKCKIYSCSKCLTPISFLLSLYQSRYNLLYSQVSINPDTTSVFSSIYQSRCNFCICQYLLIEIQLALELHVLQYYIGLYQARYNTLCILSMYRKETTRFRIPRSTILDRSVSSQIQHSLYSQHVSFRTQSRYNSLSTPCQINNTQSVSIQTQRCCIL